MSVKLQIADVMAYNVGDMAPKNHKRPQRPAPPAVSRAVRQMTTDLASWRKLRGLTQAQIAERAGVSRDTILRMEAGDGGVSLENILRVSRALGIMDGLTRATDPYETDLGRVRADEQLPVRVRPRALG